MSCIGGEARYDLNMREGLSSGRGEERAGEPTRLISLGSGSSQGEAADPVHRYDFETKEGGDKGEGLKREGGRALSFFRTNSHWRKFGLGERRDSWRRLLNLWSNSERRTFFFSFLPRSFCRQVPSSRRRSRRRPRPRRRFLLPVSRGRDRRASFLLPSLKIAEGERWAKGPALFLSLSCALGDDKRQTERGSRRRSCAYGIEDKVSRGQPSMGAAARANLNTSHSYVYVLL